MIPLHLSMPPPAPVGTIVAQAEATQDEPLQTIEMRVTSAEPRRARVDRGTVDGLALNDRVVFRPLDGSHHEGSVVQVGERDAVVELDEPTILLAPGTKAQAQIPRARRAPVLGPAEFIGPMPGPPEEREHPPWGRRDDEWKAGDPLLAHIRAFRPADRDPRISGRAYSIFDYAHSTEGSRSDAFARVGTSLLLENFLGKGGDLHFDGEANYRQTDVPDDDDEEKTRLRLDRLSYSWGGNRFSRDRFEAGRFLQHDMPEFGVLDGFQWTRRAPQGDTFGGSVGFLPRPGAEMETGDDLQVAAYYRWVADESEQFSLAGGFQKTFHNLDADRDLLVGKILFVPVGGWSFAGTAWVDLYTGADDAKGAGLGLTQAYASAGKRWEGGSSFRLTYSHHEFPENELDDFTPVTFAQLADDHVDRVSSSVREAVTRNVGVFGSAGAWTDQNDNGYDAEAGLDVEDLVFEGSLAEVAAFMTNGRFSRTFGYRTALGSSMGRSSWRVGYDFTFDDVDGFAADNDTIPQHRLRASWSLNTQSRWSFSVYAETLLFDQETSVLGGLFLQRSF